jgi:hypothetical protein
MSVAYDITLHESTKDILGNCSHRLTPRKSYTQEYVVCIHLFTPSSNRSRYDGGSESQSRKSMVHLMAPSLQGFKVRSYSLPRLRIALLLSLSFIFFICCNTSGKRDSQRYDRVPAIVSGGAGKTRFHARQQAQHQIISMRRTLARITTGN